MESKSFSFFTPEKEIEYLRYAIEVSRLAREHGNTPFGAILAAPDGKVLMEQENVEVLTHDATAHAELALIRRASMAYTPEFLSECSLYSSCEPCAMCAGAVYWANIGRLVYAMAESDLFSINGNHRDKPSLNSSCRSILGQGQKNIIVSGPSEELRAEALAIHNKYWD